MLRQFTVMILAVISCTNFLPSVQAGVIYRSRGTVEVVEGSSGTLGYATYDDGVTTVPIAPRTLTLDAGPTGSNVNGFSSFTFSQRRDGISEIFSWSTTLQRESAIEGAFLSAVMTLNLASEESLNYTFTAEWDGLSTFGHPYYLATGQGPDYVSFLDEGNVVGTRTGKIAAGTISAGSWNLMINNYVHSGSFGPRADRLDYPSEIATGSYTLTISPVTAVPEPSSIIICSMIYLSTSVLRLRSKPRMQ